MKFSKINASQIYFRLKDIWGCENFSKFRGFIKLQKKTIVECFFHFLMLNLFSIKELFNKPLEIQWNITGTLPGKLKLFWALSYKILPPEITKTSEIAVLRVIWGPENQCGIQWFFMILWISEIVSFYLLVKNSFNFKLGFFSYFESISGGIIRKDILRSDYHSARWYWCKKDQKNLLQASHNIFPQCLIVNSSLLWAFMVQNFCKNSFSGGKSRKNGIPVIKITFFLKPPLPHQNYRFPWVNTKSIKYTCRFNFL